ncbi:hypothetical protein J437_LFUL005460 [Ladona fulva]|uniref:Coiled-coil domain-containing protein 40 n=1 Tax=Ladona fulva TaxID=123851 RepID=A0A8K0NX23_LADFU|nr:hypothetical protein J437_LFUL005460 [Ladona fulva]
MQKNLKLQNELDKALKEGEKTRKLIKNHHQKLSQLSSKLNEKKENKDTLGKNNFIAQNDFLNSLKEAESEYLKIQSTYEELILERDNIKKELLTEQRTCLSWEKKIQIVTEMRQVLDKENSKEGEICTMKGEIHRMQVRLGQLHQVQEKLASDMEKCVARREAITYSSKLREKKGSTTSSHHIQTKISLNRKIEELNRRLKIVALEIKSIENQTSNGKVNNTELQQTLNEKQEKVSHLRKAVDKVTAEIAEKRMKKLQNLEEVVKGQQLVRKYQDMKDGRYKPKLTSEATLQEEMQKQLKINSDIKEIIEKLKDEFPEQFLILSRIAASLEVKPP